MRRLSCAARVSSAVAPLVLLALLTGCGGSEEPADAEPTSYVLTDLEGGTAAPDDFVPPPPTPSATRTPRDPSSDEPTAEPTEEPSAEPTDRPTRKPGAGQERGPDGDDLVAQLAAAAGRVETVRIAIDSPDLPGEVTSAVVYGTTDAFDASVARGPGQPAAVFRRVQGAFYAGTSDDLERVDPDDPELATVAGGIIPALGAWNPLLDLRSALEGVDDLVVTDPVAGAGTTSYAFSLDLGALPRPSLLVPDGVTGPAQARVSIDAAGLPVRLELAPTRGGVAEPADVVTVDYSAWGERVQIEVPPNR